MSQLHYCYSLLFLHIIFFFSLFSHEATTYLPTMAPSSRAPRSPRFPSFATIPCHYMIPRPRAHSISQQFSSTRKNLSYSVSPSTQFSIKLLSHISLSERNKLRRTRGVVDRGRGQESGLRTHLERPSCTRISIADHSTSNGFGINEVELGLYFDAHPVNLGNS
jgi:hypothetical protein